MTDSDQAGRALELGYRHLAKRDRTVAQIRRHLLGKAVGAEDAETAIGLLLEQGYLDDSRFLRRFCEDRRTLDGWGTERIERSLLAAGVPSELVTAELAGRDSEVECDAAVALLRGRLRAPPTDETGRRRALGLLVRRGYELEVAYDAVRAFERAG